MMARTTPLAIVLLAASCGGSEAEPTVDPGKPPSSSDTPDAATGINPGKPGDVPTNENGVFVAPTGAGDADGTREKPFGSIAPAIEKARANSKSVYVCSGTYKEAVVVAQGVSLVGGLDCSTPTWKLGGPRSRIESPTTPALRAENINSDTIVQDFDFVAPDGTAEKPTSIGFLAKMAGKLKIFKSSITAGKGHDGAAGTEGVQLVSAATPGMLAVSEWLAGDRDIFGVLVPEPPSVGGAGGVGACSGAPGIAGGTGGVGGRAGDFESRACSSSVLECGRGQAYYWFDGPGGDVKSPGLDAPGSPASAGNDGASAMSMARLTEDGYLPSDGKAGTNGTPGKGGKGGSPTWMVQLPTTFPQFGQTAMGAGGGAGGCPGMAGTPGRGGGASIGALISSSPGLVFEGLDIVASNGGAGGKGTFGSNPTRGSAGGAQPLAGTATPAGAGESGGRAGVSGSGAGGWSIGIAYSAGEPARAKTVIKVGTGGAGVPQDSKPDALGNARDLPESGAGGAEELVGF